VRRVAWVAMAAALGVPMMPRGEAEPGRVSRASIEATERNLNREITGLWPEDPFLLLGTARGLYLTGYGAVFTAEVDLAPGPSISPFHQTMTPQNIADHKKKMLERLPKLNLEMAKMLAGAAASLDTVPAAEKVTLGITLTPHAWEDRAGIPSQIVLTGDKARLVEAQRAGQLAPAITEQEF
jgi:hypothetical protein